MTDNARPRVTALYRYPVKGLSPEPLDAVELARGETVVGDRIYAIENGPGRFNADAPKHLPKINFLMLMRNERLATLGTRFDHETHTLTILRDGKQVARGQLSTRIGRQMIEQFLAAYMKADLRGAPHVVSAAGHSFSDVANKCLHIINLASVRELERIGGRKIDPLRFRPNVIIDGLPPWSELGMVEREIVLGQARLNVFTRTQRCDATNVDPSTAARDMAIPALLTRTLGHTDFGVYAEVTQGDTVRLGDTVAGY